MLFFFALINIQFGEGEWGGRENLKRKMKLGFKQLINTRRYGPLRGPTSSSGGGLRPSVEGFFCPSGQKIPYYAVLANFRPSLVSSSTLSNF